MRIAGFILTLTFFLTGCVSAKKFAQLQNEIQVKENQNLKLHYQLSEIKNRNKILSDSTQSLKQ